MVPNCGLIEVENRPSKGRVLKVPKITSKVKKVREESFMVEGPMLFNSMPPIIRNFDGSKECFKKLLDEFLTYIPDEPVHNSDNNNCRRANDFRSNSVRDWIKIKRKDIDKKWWTTDAEYDGVI